MCSRRSRRPTAYTRTRQLLRTTRHIVSNSPLPLTTVSLLFFSPDLRSTPRCIARCISAECEVQSGRAEAVSEQRQSMCIERRAFTNAHVHTTGRNRVQTRRYHYAYVTTTAEQCRVHFIFQVFLLRRKTQFDCSKLPREKSNNYRKHFADR